MPPNPVATVSIGKAGARNAAILAVQIMARNDPKLTKNFRTTGRRWQKKSRKGWQDSKRSDEDHIGSFRVFSDRPSSH
jgi:phosphoribosylcarboxyaminoimidazole (NCAIR) mutase